MDRGSKPNWEFKSISDVPAKLVESFFENVPEYLEVTMVNEEKSAETQKRKKSNSRVRV